MFTEYVWIGLIVFYKGFLGLVLKSLWELFKKLINKIFITK
jgi:hypothetical protein